MEDFNLEEEVSLWCSSDIEELFDRVMQRHATELKRDLNIFRQKETKLHKGSFKLY